MSATDTALCEFMEYNKWKQPVCKMIPKDENGNLVACLYPRYCSQDSTWYHMAGWQSCSYRKKGLCTKNV